MHVCVRWWSNPRHTYCIYTCAYTRIRMQTHFISWSTHGAHMWPGKKHSETHDQNVWRDDLVSIELLWLFSSFVLVVWRTYGCVLLFCSSQLFCNSDPFANCTLWNHLETYGLIVVSSSLKTFSGRYKLSHFSESWRRRHNDLPAAALMHDLWPVDTVKAWAGFCKMHEYRRPKFCSSYRQFIHRHLLWKLKRCISCNSGEYGN